MTHNIIWAIYDISITMISLSYTYSLSICKHVIACDDDFYKSTDNYIDTALLIEYQCRT